MSCAGCRSTPAARAPSCASAPSIYDLQAAVRCACSPPSICIDRNSTQQRQTPDSSHAEGQQCNKRSPKTTQTYRFPFPEAGFPSVVLPYHIASPINRTVQKIVRIREKSGRRQARHTKRRTLHRSTRRDDLLTRFVDTPAASKQRGKRKNPASLRMQDFSWWR